MTGRVWRGSAFGGFERSTYASGEFFDKYTDQVWEPKTDKVRALFADTDAARARGVLVTELTPLRSTLEDVFVDLVSAGDPGEAGGTVLGPQGEGRPR